MKNHEALHVRASARAYALLILNRIEADRGYAGITEDEPFRTQLERRDERLALEIIAGVTRWRRRLDHFIDHYYRGREHLDPAVRQVLRIGVYDLLYLNTPPYAAINESVELVRRAAKVPRATGLVNGLLRSIDRERERLPEPGTGNLVPDLGIRWSHPDWIVQRWVDRFGPEEAEKLLMRDNERPTYGLRINTRKIDPDAFKARLGTLEIEWKPGLYLDDYVRLPRLQGVLEAGLLKEGLCAVQDESAGMVVRLLDVTPGSTLIDACAAPGGKAAYAAERMQNQGTILACDVHPNRLRLVEHAARQQGASIIKTQAGDFRDIARDPAVIALRPTHILVDAPCSGLGVLNKRADLRWHREEDDLEDLTGLQDQLLDAAAELVQPGGLVLYSTCTIEPEENEARVRTFLEKHPDFSIEPAGDRLPATVVTPEGYLSTLPHVHDVDGAFGVRLRRAMQS